MKLLFAVVLFLWGNFCHSAPADFSERAWKRIEPLYQKIERHPFNVELGRGTLAKDRFERYSAQDSIYLATFSRALARLAGKLEEPAEIRLALRLSGESLQERSEASAKDVTPNLATFAYVSYLQAIAAQGDAGELAAALLPCYWIYLRLAESMKARLIPVNPYRSWIEMYSSEKYRADSSALIALTNRLAERAGPRGDQKMLEAFSTASWLEWEFWQAAYSP